MFQFMIPENPMSNAVLDMLANLPNVPNVLNTFNQGIARQLSDADKARHDESIAIQDEEDEAAISRRTERLYCVATQYLGTDIADTVRDILDESATPYEAARVAMTVMQRINNNFGAPSARGLVDRLLNIVASLG